MAEIPEYDGPNRRSTRMIGDVHEFDVTGHMAEQASKPPWTAKAGKVWVVCDNDEGGYWTDAVNTYNEGAMKMQGMSENTMAGAITDSWYQPIRQLVERVEPSVRFYSKWLEEMGLNSHVDEVAVMFNRDEEKYGWLKGALAESSVLAFNHAVDHVHTSPIESDYDVEYTFLQHNLFKWRIEAMHITRGHSPLHHSLNANRVGGTHVVHVSFKCNTVREWRHAVETLNNEAQMVQMCSSDYGRFGYWKIDEQYLGRGVEPLYVKPRLNERDA